MSKAEPFADRPQALLHASIVGAAAGLFGMAMLELFRPKLRRRIGWLRTCYGAALLAVGTAIGQALANPAVKPERYWMCQLVDTGLQAPFSGLRHVGRRRIRWPGLDRAFRIVRFLLAQQSPGGYSCAPRAGSSRYAEEVAATPTPAACKCRRR